MKLFILPRHVGESFLTWDFKIVCGHDLTEARYRMRNGKRELLPNQCDELNDYWIDNRITPVHCNSRKRICCATYRFRTERRKLWTLTIKYLEISSLTTSWSGRAKGHVVENKRILYCNRIENVISCCCWINNDIPHIRFVYNIRYNIVNPRNGKFM